MPTGVEPVKESLRKRASASKGSDSINYSDLFNRVERDWTSLRQSVGERNKVAEIMLTEAKPLGFDGNTLVIGHNTGALAERINASSNNPDIAAVFSERLRADVAVRCVIGTDAAAAGVKAGGRREVWNPDGGEAGSGDGDGDGGSEDPAPAPSPAAAPAQAVAPAAPKVPAPQRAEAQDWQSAARAASERAAAKAKRERDDIPPPPEPAEDEPPYDPWDVRGGEPSPVTPDPLRGKEKAGSESSISIEPAPASEYTREDEERDMADQAESEASSFDRRDATEVAMELLASELGARPL